MTQPTPRSSRSVFGPGSLLIGAVGAEIDASCLVNAFKIEATGDFGDPTYKLCGTSRPGTRKFTWEATGNVDVDSATAGGLFELSQTSYGQEIPFTFTPNEDDVTSAAGVLIMTPLTFGADAYGDDLTSDVSWPLVGEPTYTYGTGGATLAADDVDTSP